jgi:hypothetical protein
MYTYTHTHTHTLTHGAGNEFPALNVTSYDVRLVLPAGYVPAGLIVRTNAAGTQDAVLSASITEPASVAGALDGYYWFSDADGSA